MSATSQTAPTSGRRTRRGDAETQRILIVDDDELILRSMDRVLPRTRKADGVGAPARRAARG